MAHSKPRAGKGRTPAAADKEAVFRLSVLKLGSRLGNVAEACRRLGMDRSSFYEWRKRFRADGLDGLKNRPPIGSNHPQATPAETADRIRGLALRYPAFGCYRLEVEWAMREGRLSAITIQKILNESGLGTRRDRWLCLEMLYASGKVKLGDEQTAFVEKMNPCFRERQAESDGPGELLVADTFLAGIFDGVGKVYLHAVVDTYSSYAFAVLNVRGRAEIAVDLLRGRALPYYRHLALPVKAVLTGNGRRFCGPVGHPYESCLKTVGIEHLRAGDLSRRPSGSRSSAANGFMARFKATVLGELVRTRLHDRRDNRVDDLQVDLEAWLDYYNSHRPHLGYRNQGRSPREVVELFLDQA